MELYLVSNFMHLEARLSCLVSAQYILVYLQVFPANRFVIYLVCAMFKSASVVCDP